MYGLPNGGSSNGRIDDTLSPHEKALRIRTLLRRCLPVSAEPFATPLVNSSDVRDGY